MADQKLYDKCMALGKQRSAFSVKKFEEVFDVRFFEDSSRPEDVHEAMWKIIAKAVKPESESKEEKTNDPRYIITLERKHGKTLEWRGVNGYRVSCFKEQIRTGREFIELNDDIVSKSEIIYVNISKEDY